MEKEKLKYNSPYMEIISFDAGTDIFMASGGDNFNEDGFDITKPPTFN